VHACWAASRNVLSSEKGYIIASPRTLYCRQMGVWFLFLFFFFTWQLNLMHSSCTDRKQCKADITGTSLVASSTANVTELQLLPTATKYVFLNIIALMHMAEQSREVFSSQRQGCQSVKPAMEPASLCLKELPALLKASI